jgi:hypothetical protein
MDRRAFITIVGGCIPAVSRVAGAQAGAKTKVIGVLSLTSPDTAAHLAKAGVDALRELGWVLGQNLTATSRYAYGRLERVPELGAELVAATWISFGRAEISPLRHRTRRPVEFLLSSRRYPTTPLCWANR